MKSFQQYHNINESTSFQKDKEFIEDVFVRMEDIGIKVKIFADDPKADDPKFAIVFGKESVIKFWDYILKNTWNAVLCEEEFKDSFIQPLIVCFDQLRNDGYEISGISSFELCKTFNQYLIKKRNHIPLMYQVGDLVYYLSKE